MRSKAVSLLSQSSRQLSTVLVEGNIGSGKTTFLNFVQNKCGNKVKTFAEPLHKWRDVKGYNLFELLYKDPKKWSFPFQVYVDLTRLEIHEEASSVEDVNVVKLMERSLFSARHCFVENVYFNKLLDETEYVVLKHWFSFLSAERSTDYDLIVYLRTSPEMCYNRIQKRNRKEETLITMNYLQSLHDLHEKWITEPKRGLEVKPVIAINGNLSLKELEPIFEKCSELIFSETRRNVDLGVVL